MEFDYQIRVSNSFLNSFENKASSDPQGSIHIKNKAFGDLEARQLLRHFGTRSKANI